MSVAGQANMCHLLHDRATRGLLDEPCLGEIDTDKHSFLDVASLCILQPAMRQAKLYIVVLLCCVLEAPFAAQDRVAAAIDSLPSVKSIDQVAISPDGSQVAYIVGGRTVRGSGFGRSIASHCT